MVKDFLKLIRWKNLLFIVYIMYSLRFCLLKPILELYGLKLMLNEFLFFLEVLMTVLIAAGGYLINDYFDYENDKLNNKQTVVQKFNKDRLLTIYLIMNAIAIAIGFYLSYYISHIKIGILFFLVASLLWFYSSSYKGMFFIGNFIVALMAALVPFMVILFELPLQALLNGQYFIENEIGFEPFYFWIGGFSLLAFIITLAREIVKDMEDIKGDLTLGYNTIPIILGEKFSKFIVSFLLIAVVLAVWIIFYLFFKDWVSLIYLSVFLTIPAFYIIYKLFKAQDEKGYAFVSLLLKIYMFFGVSFVFVSCYNFSKL